VFIAADTVTSQVIGLDPAKVYTILHGHESGLGTMKNIEVLGEKIDGVYKKFTLPRYSGNFKSIPLSCEKHSEILSCKSL
jgi:uncharacterized protein (DUF362 family)